LQEGDIVTLVERIDADWVKGESADGRIGVFPMTFVEPFTPPTSPPARLSSFVGNDATTGLAVCTADFNGEQDGDLSLYEGDEVILLRKIDADWYEGELVSNGDKGVFPAAFVDVQVDVPS
jgi:hypothetical protein